MHVGAMRTILIKKSKKNSGRIVKSLPQLGPARAFGIFCIQGMLCLAVIYGMDSGARCKYVLRYDRTVNGAAG